MSPTLLTRWTAAALGALLIGSVGFVTVARLFPATTITAVFANANAIYPGDDVRIAGVQVGSIASIRADGTQAVFTLEIDHGVRVAADAKAVVVAQNLVSARYVQLTAGGSTGPALGPGAVIPRERTAVPVEWDEVKEQLDRLAADLGPAGDSTTGSVGRFIDSAADAMDGNGHTLRAAIAQLAGISRVIADGSGDITEIITNLQTFVAVLRDSNAQIVQFQERLATLTSVLDGSRSDLDSALTNLAEAVGEVQHFVAGTRDHAGEQVARLVNVTQNLVDHRADLEQVLHVAPSAMANAYNMMDPRTGGASGVFVLNNMADPTAFFCGMLGALANVTAPESAKLCAQYLGPGLDTVNFNYLPFPVNPLLTPVPSESKLIYSEPDLRPGGPGTRSEPAAIAPQDSAYQAAPPTLPQMLLPAERPAP
ncbi:mammalian cell entry protein [Mycolicibacterium duvalii]|uniref:Mammalian cell entry protein n=1 Tax=Mycolicibacterium duvalii TaxID=39688 RepID=A0A7I7K009_9MYCO|nr:MCE family protein [Mycolicibacterium duvalii]MCV7370166.1 MCE family protein [Mycolicibacterium duvalii]PEG38481.1 mammalian cell entry protein [Mycolicibacterium duvalii]BBX17470.1 mammalian cell entry protein [Mycolicibacterium duvalii]